MAKVRLEFTNSEFEEIKRIFLSPEEEVTPEDWHNFKKFFRKTLKNKLEQQAKNETYREQIKAQYKMEYDTQYSEKNSQSLPCETLLNFKYTPQRPPQADEIDKMNLKQLYDYRDEWAKLMDVNNENDVLIGEYLVHKIFEKEKAARM